MSSTSLLALIARCRAVSRSRSSSADAKAPARTAGKGKLILVAMLLAANAAGVAGSMRILKQGETPAPAPQTKSAAKPEKPQAPQVRTDRRGDPLPEGATARLGTLRWRHGWLIFDLAYSPDGKTMAAVGLGRSITLWDAATGKPIYQIRDRDFCHSVAFSPDGKILATAERSICQLWDAATGRELRQFKGHTKRLNSIAIAPDGKTLATVGSDDTARIWEVSTGKELRRLDCRQEEVHAAAHSPNGKLLATAEKDGTIRLWDAAAGTKRSRFVAHKKTIHKPAFSPDGKRLASSSEDETIRLWEPTTGRQIHVIDANLGHSSGLACPIAFSPDSDLLAFGDWRDGGTIRLWDMESGTERRRWKAGINPVLTIAFSPQGKTLAASAAWDGSIRRGTQPQARKSILPTRIMDSSICCASRRMARRCILWAATGVC